jgi:REP element-mobilizing transposase RayT
VRSRRPQRLKTFDYIGKHRYFVTCSTRQRLALFSDPAVVAMMAAQILRTCKERSFGVLAYAFMDDHLHLVIEGRETHSHFKSTMTLVRQRTAIEFRRARLERLWEDGYHERVLRPTDNVFAIIEYVRNNPAAAGLPSERARLPFVWVATVIGQP